MSTTETLRYDADQEIRDELLETCPECLCPSIVVTESYPATRIDPACSAGYCLCRDRPSDECGCQYEWG